MSGTPIRAVAYFRKSNDDAGESISQQRAWALEAARREGIVIVQEFGDQSIPGWATAKRTQFHEMIALCETQARLGNPIEAVICWHPNRFSRADSLETSSFLHQLRQAGTCRMFTQSHGWKDFRRPEDRLIFGLEQEASNHRYSADLAASTLRGRMAYAKKGLWGGPRPFGYRIEKKKLVADPVEAEAVKLIFETYANADIGIRGVALMLQERGIKTAAGRDRWCPQTLYGVLENPVYLGRVVYNRRTKSHFLASVKVRAAGRRGCAVNPEEEWVTTENAHEALVTPELFEQVQQRMAGNKKRTTPKKRGHPFLLVGLLRCGHCAGPMIGRTAVSCNPRCKSTKYVTRYYVCWRYHQFGRAVSGCNINSIREDRLIRAVAKKLGEAYFNPSTLSALREEIRRQEEADATPSAERSLSARLADLDKKIDAGTKRYMSAPDEMVEQCRKVVLEWTAERDRLRSELAAVQAKQVTAEDLDATVEKILGRAERFQDALRKGDPALARAAVREMVERIELWFLHEQGKRRVITTFARGLIYLHPASLLGSPSLSSSGASAGQVCNTIPIADYDLDPSLTVKRVHN